MLDPSSFSLPTPLVLNCLSDWIGHSNDICSCTVHAVKAKSILLYMVSNCIGVPEKHFHHSSRNLHELLYFDCLDQFNPWIKVSKGAKIRNRYKQVPQLTQDTNAKVTNSQLDTTNESQEVSPFPAGDHNTHINRHVQRQSKHKTEKT